MRSHYAKNITIHDDTLIKNSITDIRQPLLYTTNYYFKSVDWGHWYDVSLWHGLIDNHAFREILRTFIAPTQPINWLSLPKNIITVALHVRRGGGFDKPLLSCGTSYNDAKNTIISKHTHQARAQHKKRREKHDKNTYADKAHPLKFPPDSFYINALRILIEAYPDMPLYVYLFTDDQKPQHLAEKYQAALDSNNFTFAYRTKETGPDAHVLDDLYNMTQFDCLIRSDSSYSKIAELLGNHKTVICPLVAEWRGTTLHIPQVVVRSGEIRNILYL